MTLHPLLPLLLPLAPLAAAMAVTAVSIAEAVRTHGYGAVRPRHLRKTTPRSGP